MTSYATLNDPAELHDQRGFISANIVAKFCSMGIVTSAKWFPCYITIYDGILRLYDEENTVRYNPSNTVLQIPLDEKHRSSPWKRKDYSQSAGKTVDFYCFYIQKDNEIVPPLGPVRELKIGCTDFHLLEKLMRCIEFNTKNMTDGNSFR